MLTCFCFFVLGTGKSFFFRKCVANWQTTFNFPECEKIFYIYNSLSDDFMESFKELKSPPVVFIKGFNNEFMTVNNLSKIKNSVFCFDDSAHMDKKDIIRNFHCVQNHHNHNTSFLLLHSIFSKEIRNCREVRIKFSILNRI